jgi:hypothetical protein
MILCLSQHFLPKHESEADGAQMKPKRPKRSPPMLLFASRIQKKQTSPAGPIRKTAYETPRTPGNLKMKTQKRDAFCVCNFLLQKRQAASSNRV